MTRIGSLLAALAVAPAVLAAEPARTEQGAPVPGKAAQSAPATPSAKGAQPAPAPAPPPSAAPEQPLPPVARDLARALTPAEAWKGIMDGYASSLSGQIAAALTSSGKQPPPDLEGEVRKELDAAVRYEQAIDMQARALAGRFSADELRALEAFYRTGPGKKLLEELPEIARQVNDELRARLSASVPRIVERFAPSVGAGGQGQGGEGAKAAPKAQGRTPAQDKAPPRRDQR